MRRTARSDARSLRSVRDIGLLLFVAAALIAGLVHYSAVVLGRHDASSAATPATTLAASPGASTGDPSPAGSPSDRSSSPAPSDDATSSASAPAPARVSGGTTSGGTALATAAAAICWDGREVTGLASCGLPRGARGLRWVFPSLGAARTSCHRAPRPAGGYATAVGIECFAHVGGQPVAITYERVVSAASAHAAIDASYAGARHYELPGAHGGRCTWFDPASRPARVTGYYEGYPYVASLYAPTGPIAKRAWATLVAFRPAATVRGRHT